MTDDQPHEAHSAVDRPGAARRDEPDAEPHPSCGDLPTSFPGATAKSPLELPRRAWLQVAKRVFTMWGFHNLSLLGAGVAFFTFLSITPLLASTVMIYGLVGDVSMVQEQMRTLSLFLPADVAALVEEQLIAIVSTNSGVGGLALVVALAFAVYGAMRAANGMVGALNVINEEHETRGIVSRTLRVALLTLAVIFVALTGIVSAGSFAWLEYQSQAMLGPLAGSAARISTWVTAFSLGTAGFALIMRYGPDRRLAKWRWVLPGAMLATALWVVITFGFSLYVGYVSDYSATYGSLSAIIVFLMWLFLSAYGVLAGALLNAEIERQTIVDTTRGSDRPIGDRGAVLADLAEGDLTIEQWLRKSEQRAVRRQMKRWRPFKGRESAPPA